jgi:hypothetical protein
VAVSKPGAKSSSCTYLDTQVMVDALQTMTKAGVAEASAPKIED